MFSCIALTKSEPVILLFLVIVTTGSCTPEAEHLSKHFISLRTDFENGSLGDWIDESSGEAFWHVEEAVPPPDSTVRDASLPITPTGGKSGKRFLRLSHGASFNVAVLRSRKKIVPPKDFSVHNITVSFSYWVQSQYAGMNNIEVSIY